VYEYRTEWLAGQSQWPASPWRSSTVMTFVRSNAGARHQESDLPGIGTLRSNSRSFQNPYGNAGLGTKVFSAPQWNWHAGETPSFCAVQACSNHTTRLTLSLIAFEIALLLAPGTRQRWWRQLFWFPDFAHIHPSLEHWCNGVRAAGER